MTELYRPNAGEHPITPPPELVEKWLWSGDCSLGRLITITSNRLQDVATQAAQWSADQELEACCADLQAIDGWNRAVWLRSMRRPKPPTLKERLSKAIIDGDEREALKLLEELDDSL